MNVCLKRLNTHAKLTDKIFISETHVDKTRGTRAKHLSKIWKIDIKDAIRTLYVTLEKKLRTINPKLFRNYGTKNHMLPYKRIDQYFFMDTFFSTKKAGKSTRCNTCCQLFVTDQGFIYVVPMKSRSDVLQALKQFAKEIGAPSVIIVDSAREQKS